MYPVGEGGGGTQSNCSKPNPFEDTVYPVGEGGGALSLTVVSPSENSNLVVGTHLPSKRRPAAPTPLLTGAQLFGSVVPVYMPRN